MSGINSVNWRVRASALKLSCLPFINGKFVESEDRRSFAALSPATGSALCDLPVGCAADVDRAVTVARKAFDDRRWYGKTPLQRKVVLIRLADLIEQNGDELALLDTLEMGKTISDSRGEIAIAAGFFRYYGEAVDKL